MMNSDAMHEMHSIIHDVAMGNISDDGGLETCIQRAMEWAYRDAKRIAETLTVSDPVQLRNIQVFITNAIEARLK